jgi:hypothetical protein
MPSEQEEERDDFLDDNATTVAARRHFLNRRIHGDWADKDIRKIERTSENGVDGWAVWFRK